jgi:hypothetical protein
LELVKEIVQTTNKICGGKRSEYRVLVENLKERDHWEDISICGKLTEVNIKIDVREIGLRSVECIHMT